AGWGAGVGGGGDGRGGGRGHGGGGLPRRDKGGGPAFGLGRSGPGAGGLLACGGEGRPMSAALNSAVTPRRDAASANFYDVEAIRRDFPILSRKIHGHPLVFLDSAASAQKPQAVIDAVAGCYASDYANVHRGVYFLSELATERFEAARRTVRQFLNAAEDREIVFTRNATEAINLVAASYGRRFLRRGDEVILSAVEHHSNIVPWQLLRDEIGLTIKVAPVDDSGAFQLDRFAELLSERTRLVAVTHMSNAIGTVLPVKDIVRLAHQAGAVVLIDGCQAVPHRNVDVRALDADFYVFSGHKLYGPSGIGILYGKAKLLESMPPYQGGGDMIVSVSFEKSE